LTRIGVTLDGFAELVGYRTSPLSPGDPLDITLYWRARKETATSYKAFVHLLDSAGTPVAQSDAIPANWTRWTTGWLPPEVIEDVHVVSLPGDLGGRYRVVVGLYDPTSGRRAITPGGQDSVSIATLSLDQP
jgi:hypothetical protein